MNRRFRLALRFAAFAILSSLLIRANYPAVSSNRTRDIYRDNCRIVLVKQLGLSACETHEIVGSSTLNAPCRWKVGVREEKWPEINSLSRHRAGLYRSKEVSVLRQLDGCNEARAAASCQNESLPCVYGIEDPSDVLLLRSYNYGSKFVVIFRVCSASLVFFLTSILVDGSIFFPHRPGTFSIPVASLLALIAFASLLYLIIVPQNLQLSLYGGGLLQSTGYVALILMIAVSLPGFAVAWINFCLFAIYFLGFLVEQLVCMVAGILHYLGSLSIYQAQSTIMRLGMIYNRGEEEEDDFEQNLLDMSQRFLDRVRRNVFLQRIPDALEQDSLQVVESTLPDHLFDDLIRDELPPSVDFDDLTRETPDRAPPGQHSDVTTPLLAAI